MFPQIQPKYLVDEASNKTAVQLSLEEYEALLEVTEDAYDSLLYDQAKRESDGTYISLEEMKKRLGLS